MIKFNTAIILAGGTSSRMGFNKELIQIEEQKMIKIQIEKLNKKFEEIIVVTNNENYYKGLNCVTTSDAFKNKGPIGGLHAGLLKSSSLYSYLIACDMPVINTQYINYLIKKLCFIEKFACITKFGDWIEPFNAFYSKNIIAYLEEYMSEGGNSINGVLKKLEVMYIEENIARKYSSNWDMFINLNTKDDLLNYINQEMVASI